VNDMQSESEVYGPFVVELDTLHSKLVGSKWRTGYGRVGAIANGWYLRCQRSAEAAGLLEEQGFGGEAAPLRRSIIEHSVALKWLAAEGDGILDTLKRGHASAASGILDAWDKAGWEGIDVAYLSKMIEELREADRSNDLYLNFQPRAEKYGDASDLPPYRTEAGLSHPTYESAMAYWDDDEKTNVDRARPTVNTWRLCTIYLLNALQSFASTLEADSISAALLNVEARLTLTDEAHRLGFR
jgi:hypothetical protein